MPRRTAQINFCRTNPTLQNFTARTHALPKPISAKRTQAHGKALVKIGETNPRNCSPYPGIYFCQTNPSFHTSTWPPTPSQQETLPIKPKGHPQPTRNSRNEPKPPPLTQSGNPTPAAGAIMLIRIRFEKHKPFRMLHLHCYGSHS